MSEELLRQYVRRCLADDDNLYRVDEQLSVMKKAYRAGKNLSLSGLINAFSEAWGDCPQWLELKKAQLAAWPNAETDPAYQSALRSCTSYKRNKMWNELMVKYKDDKDETKWQDADRAKWQEIQAAWGKIQRGEYPPVAQDPGTGWVENMIAKITPDATDWWKKELSILKRVHDYPADPTSDPQHGNEFGGPLGMILSDIGNAGQGNEDAQKKLGELAKAYSIVGLESEEIGNGMFKELHQRLKPIIEPIIQKGPSSPADVAPTTDSSAPPEPEAVAESVAVTFDGDRIIRLAGV